MYKSIPHLSHTTNFCKSALSLAAIFLVTISSIAQPQVEKNLVSKKIKGLTIEKGSVCFLVVGDWGRNGQGEQQAVADWMGVAANQVRAKFVISTGDNFYCCGVASTEDHQWISSFENVFRCHSLQIPWFITLGNHDYQGSVQAQLDYSKKSQRWKLPARYYTYAYNGTRFVFTDTTPLISEYYRNPRGYSDFQQQDTTKQLMWIDSVLSVSTEKRKIVVGHHPIYSVGDHGSEADMKRMVEGKLEKYGVNVYFAGHDHSLQSLQRKESSLHHLVSGGGSEHTSVTDNSAIVRFAKSTTGFMVVALQRENMVVYFIDSKGKVIHKELISG